MATTTDGFPYPAATDPLGDGAAAIQALAQFLDDAWTPWTTYTPTVTNLTVGDGSFLAFYRRLFDTVEFKIRFTLGSTSEVTGDLHVDYSPAGLDPVDETTGLTGHQIVGTALAVCEQLGIQDRFVGVLLGDGNLYTNSAANWDATSPFDWEPGDAFIIRGSYQVALP